MNDEKPKVETFLTIEAECPHCGKITQLEWVDEYQADYQEEFCHHCEGEFLYRHPDCHYE